MANFHEPDEHEKKLLAFVVDHCDRWRDHRDQNHLDMWLEYERIFRGQFAQEDKTRDSERSRIISPATQQAVETRHAEVMEAIFGQGEFFDIKDDLKDVDGSAVDIEKLKAQLNEDFSRDKIRKSIDQIELMAEIYGTGIGEVVIGDEIAYYPSSQAMPGAQNQVAYGVNEEKRFYVRVNPVNPKNFLFDPNGISVDDCMGVAIERYVSVHKIVAGIKSGKYLNVDIDTMHDNDDLEASQEKTVYQDEKVMVMTYYGLAPRAHLTKGEVVEDLGNDSLEDYSDMVESIIVIANNGLLLKAEMSPYMMKDRPVLTYQDDTVPNRLLGRGTVEKAYNMQKAIDGSMRSHMDALALTVAPMIGLDATRLPRGAKFEVKPGKAMLFNGNPSEIVYPFKFGTNDGQAMETSKEFERMLLMATGTVDSAGQVSQTTRDGNLDMATATLIKKYKRTLVNFQEDFLIPFIYKAAWRYMQFDPERYPSMDVKFLPTATLGIIAREYEQKQLAFLIQTLGANSPITPVLMGGILKNSSLSNREEMLEQMMKMSQPDPAQAQMAQQKGQMDMQLIQAQIAEIQAKAQKAGVEAQLAPQVANADVVKIDKQIELEYLNAKHNMEQEQARSTNDVTIEREQAQGDIAVKQYEADLKANNETAKLELERYKVDLDAQTKLTIAEMQMQLRAPVEMPKDPVINIHMPSGNKTIKKNADGSFTSFEI